MPEIGVPHASSHEDGGGDEIDVTGLIGVRHFVFARISAGTAYKNVGNHRVVEIDDNNEYAELTIDIPDTFSSLISAVLRVIGSANKTGLNLDIDTSYGKKDEAYNAHTESDTASTYDLTANQIKEIDISGLLSSLEAGDSIGIRAIIKETYHDLWILTVRLEYS